MPGVASLDLQARLCPDDRCELTNRGAPIRPDGMHFDGKGAEEIARWVETELVAAATR